MRKNANIGALAAAGLFFAGFASAAETPSVGFDSGIDVPGMVENLKEEAQAASIEPGEYKPLFDRTERDCVTISFHPDDPLTSERVHLESRMYRERCHTWTDHEGRSHRECHDEWVRTERARVNIRIEGRGEMLPWERDVFEICLDGNWLHAWTVGASHDYDLDVPYRDGTIEARAGRKIASNPDPRGITAADFAFDPGSKSFKLKLADRWSSHYQGEKVRFELKLRRYYKNWFDNTVLKTEVELPAAEAYSFDFADYLDQLDGEIKKGKEYYAEWRFKRVGKISKDSWQKSQESGRDKFEAETIRSPKLLEALPDPDEDFQAAFLPGSRCMFSGLEDGQCFYVCRDGRSFKFPLPPGMEHMGSRGCMQYMEYPY